MKGTVPGRMMLEKIFTLEAEKLRATRMKRASLVLTPDWVLLRIAEAAAPERLPNQQRGDERAAADRQALVLEVEPCEARASAPATRGQFEICRNGHEQPDAATTL